MHLPPAGAYTLSDMQSDSDLTCRWKRKILSVVITRAQVEGVNISAYAAPASLASIHSFFVSRVLCAPVPAITITFLKPFSSRVLRVN